MTSQPQSLSSSMDDNCTMNFRGKLLAIDSNLGDQDVERLKFLCRDCVSHKKLEKSSSALHIFDHLLTEELLSEEDSFFLAELLYIIKQKSLLRHLCYTKEQVESLLPARRRVSLFRNLLYDLSEGMDSDNLNGMIFLLKDMIPKTQMDPFFQESALYRMDGTHRGHCVVVNNHSFTTLSDRRGTNKDADCLRHVFQWLGFKVQRYDNVTKGHLDEILQKYKSLPGHANGDCFVFCVLTHGEFGAVYSSDEALIPIREIMSHFTAQQCPGLAHKPKLFFIQACQGEKIQPSVSIVADAINPENATPSLQDSIPVEADFLLGLATVPGYVSFRHVEEGSWYIQSLYNHLKSLVPRREDILSILTAVNDDVSRQVDRGGTKKQMPQPAFTLRKKLVFPVPKEEL
ncbi:caspase-10 isoform X2 [Diceros bicornis minor]|uniref:caspase-10 isoform X2 n=1 Tax=Diceros bicornis minor TaxID=77932 RepID=UPI0026EA6DFC|nr:caspase-10 isoform X2 [Diceros bicornis minor]